MNKYIHSTKVVGSIHQAAESAIRAASEVSNDFSGCAVMLVAAESAAGMAFIRLSSSRGASSSTTTMVSETIGSTRAGVRALKSDFAVPSASFSPATSSAFSPSSTGSTLMTFFLGARFLAGAFLGADSSSAGRLTPAAASAAVPLASSLTFFL